VLQHRDPDKAWMLANIDREVVGHPEVQILECKTAGEYGARLWREGVPDYVQCQVQHQLAMTGKRAADVAVLICGHELRIHRIERDEALITSLIELERRFWEYVVNDTPPPVDGSESSGLALQALYPSDQGETLDLRDDADLAETFARLLSVRDQLDAHKATEALLKQQIQERMPCPSPEGYELARSGACKPYGRLNVRIGEDDELGTFILRTTGFNSIRTLAARLRYFQAVSGNRLDCLPLELRLRGKSTTQSHRAPIYYVDLTLREGMSLENAVQEARVAEELRQQAGVDQSALDAAAASGFSNGLFEDQEEDIPAIMEEFTPPADEGHSSSSPYGTDASQVRSLRRRLTERTTTKTGTA
jgi:hypothetical protein